MDGHYNFSDELIFTSNIAAINLMQTSRGLEISTAKENLLSIRGQTHKLATQTETALILTDRKIHFIRLT